MVLAFHFCSTIVILETRCIQLDILNSLIEYLCRIEINTTHKTMSFLKNFIKQYIPTVKAEDEELVDPQKILREKCALRKKCVFLQNQLTTCNDRVNSNSDTDETCIEELIDYVECVDHCVAETLFSKLK
ncbi:cytochrome b-c1 complex subunit 6, mitochondrial [Hylaeus volcanicus]|uniref:cytochrome b-c1 complex subunit 6, mitochondrial n=1 Tax=Hylaeus volcanicus TaxID=313075 RepID=UPI0023B7D879|nr:cytochrome b-c1 complex subunit 6, mitochondrial [Hylaeus volcanicus]